MTQDRLFPNDPGVVSNIRGGRNKIVERREIGGTAYRFELAAIFESLAQRDQIHRLGPV
jgi:hypothetical protein